MVKGKIVIRRINSTKSRQVTFFKRRKGLIKKAKELSILCDAEIGLIIFSCTGKVYDFASTSMKSIMERYGSMKQETNDLQWMSAMEIQTLQRETASLKQQISNLQESQRKFMGEELSQMGIEELKNLETKLDTSLKSVRARKNQVYNEETADGKAKADEIEQENIELRRKLSQMIQKYPEVKKECLGADDTDNADSLLPADTVDRVPIAADCHREDTATSDPILTLKLSPPEP